MLGLAANLITSLNLQVTIPTICLLILSNFFLALLGVPEIGGDPAFLINSTTGDITVNAKLDYESGVSSYSLLVQVSPISHVLKIMLL